MSRPPGRPAGPGNSRDAVLAAARLVFTERGYDGASLRLIAAEAGVDAAMVRHYFTDKAGLFRAALGTQSYPDELLARVLDGEPAQRGERLVGAIVAELDATGAANPLLTLIRSAVSHDESTRMLRAFITDRVLNRVAAALADAGAPGESDRQLRACLVGSQVIGLVMARYVVRVEPLASAAPESVVRAIAPAIQRYLDGDLGGL